MNKKLITTISTLHSAEIVEVSNRFGKSRMKQECVAYYNASMHGVGSIEQYTLDFILYSFVRKTAK
jgi:hypothetical protein